jgi:hypothetical protein
MKRINIQSHMKQLFREQGLMDHLPTYKEFTKDMKLVDQIKMYYDVDVDNYIGDPWEIVGEMAEDCPKFLDEFNLEFEEYLREREYIQ